LTDRRRISSGSPHEPKIGFSRAVRAGDTVYVSGTVAWGEDGRLVGEGDVYVQAKQAIANIEKALIEAGASLNDVVRTRIYLIDISRLEEAARAHGEAFGEISAPRPRWSRCRRWLSRRCWSRSKRSPSFERVAGGRQTRPLARRTLAFSRLYNHGPL